MNKRILNIIILFITFIIINIYNARVYFEYPLDGILYIIIHLFIALTITLFIKRKEHNNHIYNIIMGLFISLSTIYFIILFKSVFTCFFSEYCLNENYPRYLEEVNNILICTLLILNIFDIKRQLSKRYLILNIIVYIIIDLIYIRFLIDPLFYHNIVSLEKGLLSEYIYIFQNYLYFVVMNIILLINYFIKD